MKQTAVSLLIHLYTWLLYLYPSSFREEFGEEMIFVFATSIVETSRQGPRALARLCLKELMDSPHNLAAAHWNDFTYREVIMYRKADWTVWPSWIGLYLLSIPLATLLMLAIVIIVNSIVVPYHEWTNAQSLQLPALLLGFAVATGTVQWLLLRRYSRHGIAWGIATSLGWLAAGLLGYLNWLIAESLGYSDNVSVASGSMFVIFGVTIGLFQYLVLRRAVTKAGWWIAASAIGYSSLILLVIQPATSILEFVLLIMLPAIITGGALFLLLQQAEITAPYSDKKETQLADASPIKQKRVRAAIGILAIMLFFLVAPLVWTVGQLTLAKADGIYATPEEAMTAKLMNNSGGYEIERIDILSARPNYRDGRLPHVWFVGANVYADYRSDGKSTAPKDYWGAGSYFIKVKDGWVHVPEGAFPAWMGQVMAWYKLEDCCSTE